MTYSLPNRVMRAFNFPFEREYYFIQLPPKGMTGIRGYFIRAEELDEVLEQLEHNRAARWIVWKLVPVAKYVWSHGRYIVHAVSAETIQQ
jgi:hypothetical protein